MMRTAGSTLAALTVLVSPAVWAAERARQGLAIELLHAPQTVAVAGRDTLVYELLITNFAPDPVEILAIDVLDEKGGTLAAPDAHSSTRRLGRDTDEDGTSIAPGSRSIIYVTVLRGSSETATVRHRIRYAAAGGAGREEVVVTGGEATLAPSPAPAIGAPLRGGPWAAIYEPAMDLGHRRYVYAVHGRATIPGRLAVDWMPATGFVPTSAGEGAMPSGQGAEVLAVADARVAVAKNAAGATGSGGIEDETGAMVVLDIGHGRYAFYEHLDTILVRPGQDVRRGQRIATLGATGHVTQPHLHFHVADGTEPLSSDGLSFTLGEGHVLGAYASIEAFGAGDPWKRSKRRDLSGFPAPNAVVEFEAAR